jgi:hypothetical protein
MKIKSLIYLSSIFASLSLSAQNFTYNFDGTDNDEWEYGDALNSGGGILAQATWVMGDTNGDGTGDIHAFSGGAFQKAVFFTPSENTFGVGDTITLDTRLALADHGGFTGEKSILRVGLRDAYTNGTPLLGVDFHANQEFAFKLSSVTGSSTSARTALTKSDGNFHDLSLSITKTATTNIFDVTTSFDGVPSISYTLENSALYSVNRVFATLDSRASDQVGGILVDSFSATTVPEPSAYASIFGLMALAFVASRRKRD